MVAAFAAGIALGGAKDLLPAVWIALAVVGLLAGLWALRRDMLRAACSAVLLAWLFLGGLSARLEQLARPADNAATLIFSGRLDASEPLRWRGRLRSNPLRLPDGVRYEVDLDEVEAAGAHIPISGGLRASLPDNPKVSELPPALRAGDRAEFLVRARPSRNFLDPGAFDARGSLQRLGIDVLGTLRGPELVQKLAELPPRWPHRFARLRGRLLERLDTLFAEAPESAAVLRAMLLGDRSFVDHDLAVEFQKTAVYHVLVIAGLHVAALAGFVFWLGRRVRLNLEWTVLLTLLVLAFYVAVVEDRPPILRAGLMASLAMGALLFYRRIELLNTVALAALGLLVARPSSLVDPSFQLSFCAVGTIGAIGVPWIERSSEPYRRALSHLEDVTRDSSHAPAAAQFRLDVRAAAAWLAARWPVRLAPGVPAGYVSWAARLAAWPCAAALRVWDLCVMSFVIQVGMLALLAGNFHRVSLAGPVANIPAVVLVGVLVPLGFLALAVSFLWMPLAAPLVKAAGIFVAALVRIVGWFAGHAAFSYRIPGPPLWLLAAFFLALAMLGFFAHRVAESARAPALRLRRTERVLAGVLAGLVLCVATFPFAPDLPRGRLEATVLDVGQGDAIFLAFPGGHTMLVDGGGLPTYGRARGQGHYHPFDIGEEVVSPYLWARGIKHLDVVALTHAHQDHLGGLRAVLDNFSVGELWVSRDIETPVFRALLAEARARGTQIVFHHRGDSFEWDAVAGRILWPELLGTVTRPTNNDSLVIRLVYGRVAMLLPGDIEQQVERQLLEMHESLAADFLKIAHHGSKTSTTPEFLAAVGPHVEAISAGEGNPYGHPNTAVLEEVAGRGARLLRTDRDGAITVTSDGQTLRVSSFTDQSRR